MRLRYSSNYITNTTLIDDSTGRSLYATSTSKLGYKTEVFKYQETGPSNLKYEEAESPDLKYKEAESSNFKHEEAESSDLKYQEAEPSSLTYQGAETSALAILNFHDFSADIITLRGQELKASGYLIKPSFIPYYRRFFTTESGTTYEWNNSGETWIIKIRDGLEVGRSHCRSLGIRGPTKHTPYLELVDDPNVLVDLDEIVVSFVYVNIKRKKDNLEA